MSLIAETRRGLEQLHLDPGSTYDDQNKTPTDKAREATPCKRRERLTPTSYNQASPKQLQERIFGTNRDVIPMNGLTVEANLPVLKHNVRSHINTSNGTEDRYNEVAAFCKISLDVDSLGTLNLDLLYSGNGGLEDLPPELAKAKGLQYFYCSGHNFSVIPSVVATLGNLRELSLGKNRTILRIDEVANGILSKLKLLEVLDLSQDTLLQRIDTLTPFDFPQMPQLRVLDLSFRFGFINYFDPNAEPLDLCLPSLTGLSLRNSALFLPGLEFPVHRTLKALDLSLCFNPNLRGSNLEFEYEIQKNEHDTRRILRTLDVKFPDLKELILDSNQYSFRRSAVLSFNLPYRSVDAAEFKTLKSGKTDTPLYSRLVVKAYESSPFLTLLPVCEKIERVSCRHCSITEFPALAFETFPNATRFDFSNNPFVATLSKQRLAEHLLGFNRDGFSEWEITTHETSKHKTTNSFVITRKPLPRPFEAAL